MEMSAACTDVSFLQRCAESHEPSRTCIPGGCHPYTGQDCPNIYHSKANREDYALREEWLAQETIGLNYSQSQLLPLHSSLSVLKSLQSVHTILFSVWHNTRNLLHSALFHHIYLFILEYFNLFWFLILFFVFRWLNLGLSVTKTEVPRNISQSSSGVPRVHTLFLNLLLPRVVSHC